MLQADVVEGGCGEAGGVALRAHDDDLQVVAGGLGELGVTGGVEAPLEYVPFDDQSIGDFAFGRALCGRADVDDDRALPARLVCLGGGEPHQSGSGVGEDLFDRPGPCRGLRGNGHQSTPARSRPISTSPACGSRA